MEAKSSVRIGLAPSAAAVSLITTGCGRGFDHANRMHVGRTDPEHGPNVT